MSGNVYPLDKYIYILFFSIFILYGKYIWADTMIIDDMRNSNMNGKAEQADFCEDKSERWCFVTDKVMGGVSEGTFKTVIEGENAHYNMQGNVSTKNNGGFLQFRTKITSQHLLQQMNGKLLNYHLKVSRNLISINLLMFHQLIFKPSE